ncbi:penicillin-binding transpeptidase domain-containing protein [Streptomyces sp. CRN 30]|uniref:penicillin-binding transpeptidase domain-containing protein n=1 Tax=Streptomyces sp. CRN 30 TaxID=3075613 RepID=UPI002A81021B|nr:penicillin-binding transpeptidase domain-containing protein [Streptomyces sp. CRN 30]
MRHLDHPARHPGRSVRSRSRGGRVRAALATGVVLTVAAGVAHTAGLGPFAPGPPGPDPAATARAHAFLGEWAAGRLPEAAALTSDPREAERVLRGFTEGLEIEDPALVPAAATVGGGAAAAGEVRVPFTARMPVTGLGTWTYESGLALRERDGGGWEVRWDPSLVHPELSVTQKFRLEREDTPLAGFTDREGAPLSGAEHPSLSPVLVQLSAAAGVGPRGAIHRVDRATGTVTATEATFGTDRPGDGPVTTTIDAEWQRAAEEALATWAEGRNAAVVALRVDDGEIVAVANSPASGFNRAVSGGYAPGSTFKIVTSAALLLGGAVGPDDVVDCPKYLTVGKRFENAGRSEHRGATFREAFTESCNTAFIGLRGELGDGELGEVAKEYFGLGQEWHIGVPSYDGSVPVPGDEAEKAASMIGQGRVLASPLHMASVTATAVTGTFRRPSLVRGDPGGSRGGETTGTTGLPGTVVARLREMLRGTVTDGTAAVLAGLPGDIGAKTGTAEVNEDDPDNGWLVAHRGGVAVACVVERGGSGDASAGPVVRALLREVTADPS